MDYELFETHAYWAYILVGWDETGISHSKEFSGLIEEEGLTVAEVVTRMVEDIHTHKRLKRPVNIYLLVPNWITVCHELSLEQAARMYGDKTHKIGWQGSGSTEVAEFRARCRELLFTVRQARAEARGEPLTTLDKWFGPPSSTLERPIRKG